MTTHEILRYLRSKGSKKNVEGMARYGIVSPKAFGVSVKHLTALSKRIGTDHTLALKLWDTGWFEARILAAFIADPGEMTRTLMNRWANDFDNWAITDGLCLHLFRYTPYAHAQAKLWCGRKKEFVKRAGFSMIATLSVHDKKAPDKTFTSYLRIIERHAIDDRNAVKKAVNWALRQIGKRNASLYRRAIVTAERLEKKKSPAARWVAKDALREFRNPKIRARVLGKMQPRRARRTTKKD